jgi:phosphohistidine phosphatase
MNKSFNFDMKRLTLIRHAKSSWKYPKLADSDRPLNKRGKHDAPMMGGRLAARKQFPDLIISSPAKRAILTAQAIAKELGYSPDKIREKKRVYLASVEELIGVINKIDDKYNHVMLFGHNPGFNELSLYLTGHKVENIPTCGVFCIDFGIGSWKEVAMGKGRFVYFDFPKNE